MRFLDHYRSVGADDNLRKERGFIAGGAKRNKKGARFGCQKEAVSSIAGSSDFFGGTSSGRRRWIDPSPDDIKRIARDVDACRKLAAELRGLGFSVRLKTEKDSYSDYLIWTVTKTKKGAKRHVRNRRT